jgi:GT2 family glycosyltransferase
LPSKVSAVIPTYRREQVLVDTLRYVLALSPAAAEILVLDQTPEHTAPVEQALSAWNASGAIRWLRLSPPSIPRAMNRGLAEARHDLVLFLDDDILPEPELIAAHIAAHETAGAALTAGRVIQPWQEGQNFSQDQSFHFACLTPQWIERFMGGNFCVNRAEAIALGGFDEQFVKVAYNFEAEFAHRFCRSGRNIYYEPAACLHHLKANEGGTRTFGGHLTTVKPDHAVGDYYFMLRTRGLWRGLAGFPHRAVRSVATRHHLRRPWWIPLTLAAELRGMIWALSLSAQGPRYISAAGGGPVPNG